MLKTILVDDEPIILEDLAEALASNRHIQIVGSYQNPLEALKELEFTKPDCAFLDIEMPEMLGIDLAERLIAINPKMEIIFVTAYNNYASQAYDVSAIDYLLKPIRADRLEKSVEKLIRRFGAIEPQEDLICKIRSFGALEVISKGQPIKWGRSKSKEFLAFMLQNEGKWVSKYRLCEELRPDGSPEQSLALLQMAIYTLRKNLRTAECNAFEIKYADDRYMLTIENVDWDVQRFEEAYETFKRTNSLEAAKQGVDLYRGEYLEGEDWLWSELQRGVFSRKYETLKRALKG